MRHVSDCPVRGSLVTRPLARTGRTWKPRNRWMSVEAAHRRPPYGWPAGARASTSPRSGASGAATSLTPTGPTAFLQSCPLRPQGADRTSVPGQNVPG